MPSWQTRANYDRHRTEQLRLSDAIDASWTEPSAVLTSSGGLTSTSTFSTVYVSSHVRRYPDNTTVTLPSTHIPGLTFALEYAFYYTDPTRASTTPAIAASTNLAIAANNYAAGRHFLGNLTMPSSAAAAGGSGGTFPSGGGGSYDIP